MKEKYIAKASVFFAFIGLALMYSSSLYLSIEHVKISEIEKSWTGKNVKISGNITQVSESSGHLFLEVRDGTGKIKVVDFDSQSSFKTGETVNITGHVELYRGKLEVIAKSIERS